MTGEKTGIIVALHDVTRLQQLETIRRDFVANVSHELKTPITSIKGSVETLIQGALKDTNAAKQFLEITSRQADRLNSIIEDLLTLSRLEQGHSGDEGAGPIVLIDGTAARLFIFTSIHSVHRFFGANSSR